MKPEKRPAWQGGMKWLKNNKMNETLRELLIGILIWGACWQAGGVWFVKDKAGCSLGLWAGIVTAEFCAVHMYRSLDRALDLSEKDAQKYMMSRSMMRYGLIIVVLLILMITEAGNPLCGFLGVMGLKAAAYLQPLLHKVMEKRRR